MSRINRLKKKIELIKKQALINDKYSFFYFKTIADRLSKCKTYVELKEVYDMVNEMDNKMNISYNDGLALNTLASDQELVMCVNNDNLKLKDSLYDSIHYERLEKIMEKGLTVNKQDDDNESVPLLSLTTSSLNTPEGMNFLTSPHKENDCVLLFAFPSRLVSPEGEIKEIEFENKLDDPNNLNRIYNYKNGKFIIKPEFIFGVYMIDRENSNKYDFYKRADILASFKKDEIHFR